MTRSFALAAAAVLGLTFVASAAQAESKCPVWMCGSNGTSLNGQNLNGAEYQGIRYNGIWENGTLRQGVQVNGLRQQGEAMPPTVKAVILPSGETIEPR